MPQAIETYLDRVMIYANRPRHEAALRAELRDHLEQAVEQLQADGLSREDAVFQAIEDHGDPRTVGYGLRGGFPWLDVRTRGTARGVIAIGPRAVGIVAMGGASCGVISCGGLSVGLVSLGGFAASLLFSFAGFGVSTGLAYGGFVLATLAFGGVAMGAVALGGFALGLLAEGGRAISLYTTATAPETLAAIAEMIPNAKDTTVGLVLFSMGMFAPLMGLMSVLQAREHRRIRRADPKLMP